MGTLLLPELAGADRRSHLLKARAHKSWYRIDARTEADEAEVYIYDEIGYFGTSAQQFVRDLQAVKAGRIRLHLNTPGGDVFDGIAIHNALRDHAASVTVQVDSLAASIGSVIAMAGERVTMARHATMMIHDPYGAALGNADDMRKMAEVLDQLGDTIAGIYAERAGGAVSLWRSRMAEETWYTDRAAVEAGLADDVAGDDAAEAENRFDLSIFRHPPADCGAGPSGSAIPTVRDIERALRDAGLTRGQAKKLAGGYSGIEAEDSGARDAAELEQLLDALKALR